MVVPLNGAGQTISGLTIAFYSDGSLVGTHTYVYKDSIPRGDDLVIEEPTSVTGWDACKVTNWTP